MAGEHSLSVCVYRRVFGATEQLGRRLEAGMSLRSWGSSSSSSSFLRLLPLSEVEEEEVLASGLGIPDSRLWFFGFLVYGPFSFSLITIP